MTYSIWSGSGIDFIFVEGETLDKECYKDIGTPFSRFATIEADSVREAIGKFHDFLESISQDKSTNTIKDTK